jgi:tetratricopeptide (TPR) repeat protein
MNTSFAEFDALNKVVNEARREILVNKKPLNAIGLLLPYKKTGGKFLKQTLALAYFQNKQYLDALGLYYEIGQFYQSGFCYLLMENEAEAAKLWNKAPDSPAARWGKSLLSFINLKIDSIPSVLQVRSHLECDLGHLLTAGKIVYAENLISCDDFLYSINPESYKFIGKALMIAGHTNLAVTFFLKSQKAVPEDAEIYYHLGQYSFDIGAYEECLNMMRQCLSLNVWYLPAQRLLDKLSALSASENQQ